MKQVKHPCIKCKYFNACGNIARTQPCDGRQLKGRRKDEMVWDKQY